MSARPPVCGREAGWQYALTHAVDREPSLPRPWLDGSSVPEDERARSCRDAYATLAPTYPRGINEPALHVTRAQALAFRLRRHHLTERLGPDGAQSAAVVGLQDTPPGSAGLALAARAEVGPEALDELVLVPSIRGAPLAVAEQDLGVFTAGLEPPDEKAARALIGNAWKSLDGITAIEALDRVSEAVRDSLRDGPRPRDDFHQALRERLPKKLLWWCRGCESHHVHPSLWRATGVRGVLAIVGREGRSAVFGLPPEAPALDDPGGELARRFLRAYGPARPKLFADWGGLATSHANALWERAGALSPVNLEGTKAWVLVDDESALVDTTEPEGPRLLPNLDPLNAGRDREILAPDPAVRKRIWKVLGGPGTVLVSGGLGGLWRSTRKGKKLVVTVEPLGKLTASAKDALAAEAERIAAFRDAEISELRTATL